MPEPNRVRVEVNVIRNVMPHIRRPRRIPLALPTNVPPEVCVASPLAPGNQAVLHLREVALEESDLVLA